MARGEGEEAQLQQLDAGTVPVDVETEVIRTYREIGGSLPVNQQQTP